MIPYSERGLAKGHEADGNPFRVRTIDLTDSLPAGFQTEARQEQFIETVLERVQFRDLVQTPKIIREAPGTGPVWSGRVEAEDVKRFFPWIPAAFHGRVVPYARKHIDPTTVASSDERTGTVLNVMLGPDPTREIAPDGMRFVNHIDSNPYALSWDLVMKGKGGVLAIANNPSAASVAEVDRDCIEVPSIPGMATILNGGNYPHHVRRVVSPGGIRIVATGNLWNARAPESSRPPMLNLHRFGKP